MPSERKKKALKNEDFKKKRLKVGKKKAVPDSFTDTSFKSRTVVLPNQSITENKSHEITTHRNLTLADLVVQLRHYNSGVKKDALNGLTEICNEHPELLVSSLGSVVNGLIKLFIDEDKEVRKAMLTFLKNTFVRIDRVEIQPFISLLIIYTCSAMTHIFEDVRADAVKLMDLWMDIAPEVIVNKFWNRIIGNYMSLLAVNNNLSTKTENSFSNDRGITTTASVKAAVSKSHLHIHKHKLDLFMSLSKFIEAGLSTDGQNRFWFMMNYLDSDHAKETFRLKMDRYSQNDESKTVKWNPKIKNAFFPSHPMGSSIALYLSNDAEFSTYSHLHLFESSGPKTSSNTNSFSHSQKSTLEVNNSEFSSADRVNNIKELIEIFQPILVASWLEAAPSVFVSVSTISHSPALELLHAILKFSLVLWRSMVGSGVISSLPRVWLQQYLQTLIKHFTVYFPFGADSYGQRPADVDDLLQQMNIMLCELTSLFLLARTMQTQITVRKNRLENDSLTEGQQHKRRRVEKEMIAEDDAMPEGADLIVDYVLGVLGHHVDDKNMSSASTQFQTNHLISLLPAIWGFLNCLNEKDTLVMFDAFVTYFNGCQPSSASKKVALEFISRVYLLQSTPSYNGHFVILPLSPLADVLKRWAVSLPKLLWQLRTTNASTTRYILNVMCDIAKRGDKDIFEMDTLKEIELKLVPFFWVELPKGPLFGPFKSLPADIQQRALDYVDYVHSQSPKIANAIDKCRDHLICNQ